MQLLVLRVQCGPEVIQYPAGAVCWPVDARGPFVERRLTQPALLIVLYRLPWLTASCLT